MNTEHETTPCDICGTPTSMLGTKLCDRCWELKTRITSDPEIARRILLAMPDVEPEPGSTATNSDEWQYRQTRYSAEARVGKFTVRLHWTGLADIEDTRATMQQIVTEHNGYAVLVTERERLRASLRLIRSMLVYIDDLTRIDPIREQLQQAKIEIDDALASTEQGGERR